MPPIDHLYFPHIVDNIWQHFSVAQLKSIRNVCKTWRLRVDLAVSNHIAIEQRANATVEILARCVEHPDVSTQLTPEAKRGIQSHKGVIPWDDSGGCKLCARFGCEQPPVIDIVGFKPRGFKSAAYPCLERLSLTTTRWHLDPASDKGKRVCLPTFGPKWVVFSQLDDIPRPDIKMQGMCQDVTLNFYCCQPPTTAPLRSLIDLPIWPARQLGGRRARLTYIFHDGRPEASREVLPTATFIFDLLKYYPTRGFTVTLVGLDQFVDSTTLKEFQFTVCSGHRGPHFPLLYSAADDFKHVHFQTFEQFRTSVGDLQYKIATVR